MPGPRDIRNLWLWTCASAVLLAVLAASLPPHGFFSGDQGVKLIAAQNAIAHPARPFQVDLPEIGGEAVPFVDRFFSLHDDHAHALQSPLFPAITAPFIATFGLRGAYILPAVSFVAFLPLAYLISRRTDAAIPLGVLAVVALLANPILFYALEYWEVVPAVACLAGCTLALRPAARPGSRFVGAAVWAGALAATAVMLRPDEPGHSQPRASRHEERAARLVEGRDRAAERSPDRQLLFDCYSIDEVTPLSERQVTLATAVCARPP